MFVIVSMSAVSVAACLVTLSRVVGWKRILRHATLVDVGFTIGLAMFLAGTMTGALTAVLAGLMMALVLTVLRKLVGFAGDVSDRVQTDAKPAVHVPEGADPSEYNAHGWIYNQAPYV
ncbi:hypothetical protein ParaKuw1_00021 [Paracoccus phage ParKuw1]|uniref:Uncharacterized protein n=1 Tax=Paracoccus phage ParKuw1 TaxID=3032415 RepID=A0AAF0JHZ1_9CAUD|nr:hypothetical protein ParaKuw1_00021 [Paracoccus phage ParKuw1]